MTQTLFRRKTTIFDKPNEAVIPAHPNKPNEKRVPDGTGLQIVFNNNEGSFLVCGPRGGKVNTENGGRILIDDLSKSYFEIIKHRLKIETFGVMSLGKEGQELSIKFQLNGIDYSYPLTFNDNNLFQNINNEWEFIYFSFAASCNNGPSLEVLQQLADKMRPTAAFWAELGGFLFEKRKQFLSDVDARPDGMDKQEYIKENYPEFWRSIQDDHKKAITNFVEKYNELTKSGELLQTPEDAFGVKTLDQAIDKLQNLYTWDKFNNMFLYEAGRFSERAGYFVFDAHETINAAIKSDYNYNKCRHESDKVDSSLSDVTGNNKFPAVFNDLAVINVLQDAVTGNPQQEQTFEA